MRLNMGCVLLVGFLLAGCVSTTDSRFAANENKEEALRKFTELGLIYIRNGKTEEAMPPLKRALEIDPKSAEVHTALALLFQAEKDTVLAENHFQNALQYSSTENNTRIRNNYAAFLYQSERYADACQQLEKAGNDAFYERRATVFENLGLCYLQVNERVKALAAFERSLSINDGQPRALLEASRLYFEAGNIQQSEVYHRMYQRLVRYNMAPNTPKNLWLGVQLARLSGDKDGEASYSLMLKNMFPNSSENEKLSVQ